MVAASVNQCSVSAIPLSYNILFCALLCEYQFCNQASMHRKSLFTRSPSGNIASCLSLQIPILQPSSHALLKSPSPIPSSWDEFWDGCYHVFPKFPFWFRNMDVSNKSTRGGWSEFGMETVGTVPNNCPTSFQHNPNTIPSGGANIPKLTIVYLSI